MNWDEFGKKAGMFLNSAYKGVAGESISQYVGTGRVTNIFGRDQKFVFDWNYLFGSLPMDNKIMKAIIFNGGTSSINLGANHSINFGGVHLLTAKVGFIGAKVTIDDGKPDITNPEKLLEYEAKYLLPHRIAYAIGLISITVFVVCLLRWEDFTTNPEKIENWEKSIDTCKLIVVTGSFIVIDFLYKWIIYFLQALGIADALEAKVKLEGQNLKAKEDLDKRFLAIDTKMSELEIGLRAQLNEISHSLEKALSEIVETININVDDLATIMRYGLL